MRVEVEKNTRNAVLIAYRRRGVRCCVVLDSLKKTHIWCARISLVLSAGEIPVLARVKPAHQESSLGLMEVTT